MGEVDRPLTAAEQRMLARLRKITARLPEVTIVRDGFGHSTFKVRRKSFVILGVNDHGPDLAIKSDPVTQDVLIRRAAWYRTPYIGPHGWVSIDGEDLDWGEIAELVMDAYRLAAPKSLLRRLDSLSEPPGSPSRESAR